MSTIPPDQASSSRHFAAFVSMQTLLSGELFHADIRSSADSRFLPAPPLPPRQRDTFANAVPLIFWLITAGISVCVALPRCTPLSPRIGEAKRGAAVSALYRRHNTPFSHVSAAMLTRRRRSLPPMFAWRAPRCSPRQCRLRPQRSPPLIS